MRIVVFKYGESVYNESFIFSGGDPDKMLPISFVFYLIQTKGKNILVDVGCNDGAGFEMKRFCKPVEALKSYGLKPEEITDVVITHAHHDHIEAIGAYKNAVIHIQESEYETGQDYFPAEAKVCRFKGECLLCPNVLLKEIGGHSKGSSIVICELDEKQYVLCGDECYVKACFAQKIPTGSSCDPVLSEAFVLEYSKSQYVPLLFHDPDILTGRLGYDIVAQAKA